MKISSASAAKWYGKPTLKTSVNHLFYLIHKIERVKNRLFMIRINQNLSVLDKTKYYVIFRNMQMM